MTTSKVASKVERRKASPKKQTPQARLQKAGVIAACFALFAGAYFLDGGDQPKGVQLPASNSAKPVAIAQVPDMPMVLLNGTHTTLYAYKGQPVLINFWATWCAPCIEEMPELLKAAEENQNLTLILASVDDTPAKILPFFAKLGLGDKLKLRNVVLATDPEQALAKKFQSYQYPESYLLTAEMGLQHKFVGKVTAAQVHAKLP